MYKKRFEDGGEIGAYVGQSGYENPEVGSSLFAGLDLNALGIDPNLFAEGLDLNALLPSIIGDADVMNALKAQDPAAYAALLSAGELSGFAPVGSDNPPTTGAEGAGFPGEGIKSGVKEWDDAAKKAGVELTDPNAKTGLAKILDDAKKGFKDLTGLDAGDAAKYAAMLAMAKMTYNDAQEARKEARGWTAPGGVAKQAVRSPGGGVSFKKAAMGGGIGSLDMARGGRALPPRYLKGHSDGMADKVPAHIDGKRPAALSDGEFVIPADVVSHLGNGNSNAGAKRLYKMMDDIRAARTGNPKQGKQINPDKFMPR